MFETRKQQLERASQQAAKASLERAKQSRIGNFRNYLEGMAEGLYPAPIAEMIDRQMWADHG